MPQPTPQPDLVAAALTLYREGWFPMADEQTGRVEWVQPRQRGVIPLDDRFHVSRRLRERVRSGRFTITSDRAFGQVIRACAAPAPGREQTWLSREIIALFEHLHDAGHAHSVEAWLGNQNQGVLVGGTYGLAIGRVFAGESMFSRPKLGGTDASKVCLVHLVEHLRRCGFVALDAQLSNPHLEQFGLYEVPREVYLAILHTHAHTASHWQPISSDPP